MPSEDNILKEKKETCYRLNKSVLLTAVFMNPERQSIYYLNRPIYWTAQTGSLYSRVDEGSEKTLHNIPLSASSAPATGSFSPLPGSFAWIKVFAPVTPFLPQSRTSGDGSTVTCAASERGAVQLHRPRPAPSYAVITLLATSQYRCIRESRKRWAFNNVCSEICWIWNSIR